MPLLQLTFITISSAFMPLHKQYSTSVLECEQVDNTYDIVTHVCRLWPTSDNFHFVAYSCSSTSVMEDQHHLSAFTLENFSPNSAAELLNLTVLKSNFHISYCALCH